MTDDANGKVTTLTRSHRATPPPRDVLAPLARDVVTILEDRGSPMAERVASLVNALMLASVALFMNEQRRIPRGEEADAAFEALLARIAAQLRAHVE